MRVSALLALACTAAIARADVIEDAQDAVEDAASSVSSGVEDASSSVASVVESVTTSNVEKPTFTVRFSLRSYRGIWLTT